VIEQTCPKCQRGFYSSAMRTCPYCNHDMAVHAEPEVSDETAKPLSDAVSDDVPSRDHGLHPQPRKPGKGKAEKTIDAVRRRASRPRSRKRF
jgi:hypothetical protein